jgi:glycolate oxidase FAD binding subunit
VPITASCWCSKQLHVRLEGSAFALQEIAPLLGGEIVLDRDADSFWCDIRDQRHAFFTSATTLWRVNVPALTPVASAAGTGSLLLEWNGSLRWYADCDPTAVNAAARAGGGFATRFRTQEARCDPTDEVFAPLPAAVMTLHRSLKRVFDPAGICNPGRMYAGL